ncbi:hypothetical protein GDS87_24485 (plasmid) [Lysinibacillus pakistanensis]|uniref:Restriction endonuclease n=2 Tax=Lysinibacillus pakistanensis TaxID=759811 RepID=A0ABX6DGX8_9BACI|nr:hypothetical protein GDS87_24485 [Lysinibacillus pakistanensis]
MWQKSLLLELRKYANSTIGKDPDRSTAEKLAQKLYNDFKHISTQEIGYCLDLLVGGETGIEPDTFKLSGTPIVKMLKQYDGKRKAFNRYYWEIKNEENSAIEAQRAQQEFLRQALMKKSQGATLTVYERSTIGKHLIESESHQVRQAIWEDVDKQLPTMQRELKKKRDGAFGIVLNDQDQQTPIMWTDKLLYGCCHLIIVQMNKDLETIIRINLLQQCLIYLLDELEVSPIYKRDRKQVYNRFKRF